MNLQKIAFDLSICKVGSETDIDLSKQFYFIGKTDDEISLVCRTDDVPSSSQVRSALFCLLMGGAG